MKKSQNDFRLLPEINDDYLEVERLLDLVFTPKRRLLSSYQLRSSTNKVNNLSYVLKDRENNIHNIKDSAQESKQAKVMAEVQANYVVEL